MKQRITPEQLAELTDSQKEQLREWWQYTVGDMYYDVFDADEESNYIGVIERDTYVPGATVLPILTIGQMIEFLQQAEVFDDMDDNFPLFEYTGGYVGVCWDGRSEGKELVDSLWQAVQAVL